LTAVVDANKTYDGTNVAELGDGNTTLSGFVIGQGATVNSSVTGQYSTANVGNGLAITGAALTAGDLTSNSGTLLSNYTLPTSDNGTGDITPKTLVYVANAVSGYVGNVPTLTGQVTGFVPGQTLANATQGILKWKTDASNSSAPGKYNVLGTGLTADHGNYIFMQSAGNADALTLQPGSIRQFSAVTAKATPLPALISYVNKLRYSIAPISPYRHVPVLGVDRRGFRSVAQNEQARNSGYPVIVQKTNYRFGHMGIELIDGGVKSPNLTLTPKNKVK
jgi:hypothetical protein